MRGEVVVVIVEMRRDAWWSLTLPRFEPRYRRGYEECLVADGKSVVRVMRGIIRGLTECRRCRWSQS